MLDIVDLILAKREGRTLDVDQIGALIRAYTKGNVPDYQMSAFLMAGLLRGLNDEETFALSRAMLESGTVIDLSRIRGPRIGKHSTGGVGDKVSMILGPIVAACGVRVPKLSGRGLGFTGGTLDKLESIPGFRVDLSIDEFVRQLDEIGLVITGQSDEIAPADRALYALRDVTGTVDYIPYIASSIMSKKLAEGTDALVLDVKCGRGAFMKTEADARKLAESLVAIGDRFGKRTVAWLTDMNEPLGRAIGNWPEVVEAVECLQGANRPDLMSVVYTLASEMIYLGGLADSLEDGQVRAEEAVRSGAACDRFMQMVERQGGDVATLENLGARESFVPAGRVEATRDGYVGSIDALEIGRTAVSMGAGRAKKGEPVDLLAGIVLQKRAGDPIRRGEVAALLYTKRTERIDHFRTRIAGAIRIQKEEPERRPVVIDRFADGRWGAA